MKNIISIKLFYYKDIIYKMDFRNVLVPNDNVNLYCSSITRAENAYAIAPTANVVVSLPSTGGIEIYEFRFPSSPIKLLNIALSPDAGTFTISKKGVYSILSTINASATDVGSQSTLSLLVNGVVLAFDILFPAGNPLMTTLTVMAAVECDGLTAKDVSIQIRYLAGGTPVTGGEFRYGQLSIIKISD
jgi:hypothetical protein